MSTEPMASALPVTEAPRAPAMVELLLHPARFFQDRAGSLTGGMFLIVMAVLGMAGRIDNMDSSVLTHGVVRQMSWTRYWGVVIGGAILTGPLRYAIGGWFCRMRLKWCGAGAVEPSRARALSGMTDLIWAVPAILSAVIDTVRLPDPASAWAAGVVSAGEYSLIMFNLWSVFSLYSAVTGNFTLNRRRARFWFWILPTLLLLAIFSFALYRGISMQS